MARDIVSVALSFFSSPHFGACTIHASDLKKSSVAFYQTGLIKEQ